ncbi:MAG: 30S ribosomal protein S4 [Candidatus Zambryskibacteria bacterium CG_4_9_14_3_um_filter_42_9]|uniref:Small ribosomal subunit protein uS4 n=1 Tax=Candidatus Zambryskibacteria bacterium CG22_combo_CG10-13_8_21_14_all_42_17 TaxID=1975118 RepID=A0A2H0BE99_9BACT|nr:MAG: 30S ribosomal protein S4 [Candidatus Zambryskibacteria bacterium CG22_combo_CG10-13_8_21_14_all_42_17]PJA36635.1 MAG: 30S ribosomal protein S4 [Candidatus Zambryskibacteria bacterium CG_4_9_14_3_um_filter_42_9]
MKIGPKYKIARRLGAPVFEKTQTPKYALSLARKERADKKGRRKPKSEFGQELIEKQKARFSYGITEKQFRNYVDKALNSPDPIQKLFSILESRLDNVVYRAGLAKTRAQARQAVSHGHIMVNNARVTIPSIIVSKGDVLSLRPSSADSPLFTDVSDRMKEVGQPPWLKADPVKKSVVVEAQAVYEAREHVFDLGVVIEFYNR